MVEKELKSYKFDRFELRSDGLLFCNGKRVNNISPKERKVLHLLITNRGRLMKSEEIITAAWGTTDPSNLTTTIAHIRKALHDDSKKPKYIETHPTEGYSFVAEVDIEGDAEAQHDSTFKSEGSIYSKLDELHLHVDGGEAKHLIDNMVFMFEREKRSSKINHVIGFAAGPQREDLPQIYEPHTPGGLENENLKYFSTHLLGNFAETKRQLSRFLSRLKDIDVGEIVVEVERVIGRFSDDRIQQWSATHIYDFPALCSGDAGYEEREKQPIEIHYAINIRKEGKWRDLCPIDISELPKLSSDLGIRVGGWFVFADQNNWAYRSNMFAEEVQRDDIENCRRKLKVKIEEIGSHRGFTCEVKALVEQTIGVWKTPLKTFGCSRSVTELSDWEAKYPDLRDFWVVTPNFLGDKEKLIEEAMIKNLNRGVKYTYFLLSVADHNRLMNLVRNLSEKLRPHVDLKAQIQAVMVIKNDSDLRALEKAFQPERSQGCFIANPIARAEGIDDVDGYLLIESENPGQISHGRLMQRRQIKEIVDLLTPLVTSTHFLQGYTVRPQEKKEIRGAIIVCTNIEGLHQLLNNIDDESCAEQLRKYDLIVSNKTSAFGGQVVRSIESGYFLLFKEKRAGLLCAEQIQTGVDPSLRQKIAIDTGDVWQVIRAHGFDYCGKTVTRCRDLLKISKYNEVVMTEWFAETLIGGRFTSKIMQTEKVFEFEGRKSTVWKLRI